MAVDTIAKILDNPWLKLFGAGAGGAISGLPTKQTSVTNPIEPAGYSTLGDLLRSRATSRMLSNTDMSGYEANGISDINSVFNPISQSVNNSLTSRGLATSPVAASADATIAAQRGSNIAQFINTIPQLQRQYQNEDFDRAANLFNARKTGVSQTTSGSDVPGGVLGGAASGVLEHLGELVGQGLLSPSSLSLIHI